MRSLLKGVDVAFVWHMHQPDYRDRAHRRILLPWARLHALKDYYDMPARLAGYEGICQTFNLVPSLIEQIECYTTGTWSEEELELFTRRADELSEQERHSILKSFFLCPEEYMIRPYPRYAALLRDFRLHHATDLLHRWSPQEWRDLQFWRQLAWFDPLIRDQDPVIEGLIRQGQNFEESNKEILLERMKYWLGESLAIYRRLQDKGVIEVSVTPFYHPILPLLADPASVREAMPDCPLPEPRGEHPDDARAQVEKAITFYQERFGRYPRGMWPSEGSVSQQVAEILSEAGLEWFASDEAILARSLGIPNGSSSRVSEEDLYQPYRTLDGNGPTILFRDHRLSDLIGFEYSRWEPEKAAKHFVDELLAIGKRWKGEVPPVVPVILDGENCWEYYDRDGGPFLDALYHLILEHPEIRCRTVSQILADRDSIQPLQRLAAGSWIQGNFYIWMGEEADRRAWGLLEQARRDLVEATEKAGFSWRGLALETSYRSLGQDLVEVTDKGKQSGRKLEEAWEELYVAEGSDWFWWFGESQTSSQDSLFDEMFRFHLVRVYELANLPAPAALLSPVEPATSVRYARIDPHLPCPPTIDGRESHYYEWRAAERFEPGREGGAMQQAVRSKVSAIYYGVDESRFYLRVDPLYAGRSSKASWKWELRVTSPKPVRLRFVLDEEGMHTEKLLLPDPTETLQTGDQVWHRAEDLLAQSAESLVFEAALTWELLESTEGETLSFFIGYPTGKNETELIPPLSSLCVVTPGKSRPGRHWFP